MIGNGHMYEIGTVFISYSHVALKWRNLKTSCRTHIIPHAPGLYHAWWSFIQGQASKWSRSLSHLDISRHNINYAPWSGTCVGMFPSVCLPSTGIILGIYMSSANERRCYNVTSSLIVWAHTQNDACRTEAIPDPTIHCHTCSPNIN